jgi:hypothetical protein
LWLRSRARRICSYLVDFAASSETEKRLESSRWRLATIVSKDEFIQVKLQLALADTVMGTNQPLLQVANRSIGKWDGGLCALSQFCALRLDAGCELCVESRPP